MRTGPERDAHFRIRHQVFVREQRLFLPPGGGHGDDRDGRDADPATIHVIGLAGEAVCGTVRLYPLDSGSTASRSPCHKPGVASG